VGSLCTAGLTGLYVLMELVVTLSEFNKTCVENVRACEVYD
jgi:hypothetical protein